MKTFVWQFLSDKYSPSSLAGVHAAVDLAGGQHHEVGEGGIILKQEQPRGEC